MASSGDYTTSPYAYTTATATPAQFSRRASTQVENRRVEEDDAIQGRVFWLPPKEDLPDRAVRRAHGKGAIEEGIYNHPVVVVSRPADDPHVVHFHLITSFQGKRLHEIYGKNNEFHASRRSWYLPIAPTPDHPDASSKKSKKRFPTLDLAGGAALRWDSYVNLRHVYRIDWSLLKPYANPDTPYNQSFRFERESMIRLLAKSKVLTTYEAGTQWQRPRIEIPQPRPRTATQTWDHTQPYQEASQQYSYPQYSTAQYSTAQYSTAQYSTAQYSSTQYSSVQYSSPQYSAAQYSPASSVSVVSSSSEYSSLYSPMNQLHFLGASRDGYRNLEAPPKAPPDRDKNWKVWDIFRVVLACVWGLFVATIQCVGRIFRR